MNLSEPKQERSAASPPGDAGGDPFYEQAHFHHLLRIERRRTERSKKPFLMMLLDLSRLASEPTLPVTLPKLNAALASALRETDIRGWYDHNRSIGVIFTEMKSPDGPTIERIFDKVRGRLGERFPGEQLKKIDISFHIYPETQGTAAVHGLFNTTLYPDLTKPDPGQRFAVVMKKMIDIGGSSLALLIFSPMILVIAAAIKLTSAGPVFFRQERLGLNGESFELLKFRSMYVACDPGKHQEYIRKYICDQKTAAVEPGVFKLTHDLRVTPVGRLLRKTSLDELPQLINVLKGEMSLVGPRPPLLYEYDLYDAWHRRRLLACKPGITGLWQVLGRSRTTFDEMVRLDLKYIHEWSLWLDLKILLKTPGAVFGGKGAY